MFFYIPLFTQQIPFATLCYMAKSYKPDRTPLDTKFHKFSFGKKDITAKTIKELVDYFWQGAVTVSNVRFVKLNDNSSNHKYWYGTLTHTKSGEKRSDWRLDYLINYMCAPVKFREKQDVAAIEKAAVKSYNSKQNN